MIQVQLKIRLKTKQEALLESWLPILTSIWNWAIKKIERDSANGIFYTKFSFQSLLGGHSKKLEISSQTIKSHLVLAWQSWDRCFKKISKKPRFKGVRNKLNSISFPDKIKRPEGTNIKLPLLGVLRFHKQEIPDGVIKCGRLVKRASGWYLCLFIDAEPKKIEAKANGKVGIDPGFSTTLTLSDGTKINKPKRQDQLQERLGQAQRGKRKQLTARLQERIKNRRKEDNHKLSRMLVENYSTIAFSKDNITGIAKKFGKSVAESSHYQLRQMLSYKCRAGGREYLEVDSKHSTMTCSKCLALTGPTGLTGLKIRQWECSGCGSCHDRDVNAAINTLIAGFGSNLEKVAQAPVRNP